MNCLEPTRKQTKVFNQFRERGRHDRYWSQLLAVFGGFIPADRRCVGTGTLTGYRHIVRAKFMSHDSGRNQGLSQRLVRVLVADEMLRINRSECILIGASTPGKTMSLMPTSCIDQTPDVAPDVRCIEIASSTNPDASS